MPGRPEQNRDQFRSPKGRLAPRPSFLRAAQQEDRNIRFGHAMVVFDRDKQAWALTGGRLTRDEWRAREHAILMDGLIKRGMSCE